MQGTSNHYNLYACQPLDYNYDKSGKSWQPKGVNDFEIGIDYTKLSYIEGTCRIYFLDGQFKYLKAYGFTSVNDLNFYEEYDSNGIRIKDSDPTKGKLYVEFDVGGDTIGNNYQIRIF